MENISSNSDNVEQINNNNRIISIKIPFILNSDE